jgi:PTH1 family peptidyl-tRNA hydrolase
LRGGDPSVDWLVVGLGNPGSRYAGTRHNIGFAIANQLIERWDLGRLRRRYSGLVGQARLGSGSRVSVLLPQTFMNEAGRSVGPARGAFKLDLDRVVLLHDDIDLAFGDVRTRLGGGLGGHNGLKSVRDSLGGDEFYRVRAGVGRPESTDPDTVARYVLTTFTQPETEIWELIHSAADACERLVTGSGKDPLGRPKPP